MKKCLQDQWRAIVTKDSEYEQMTGFDYFASWDRQSYVESALEELFENGLGCEYSGDATRPIATTFFLTAFQYLERVIKEEKWHHKLCENTFPLNRGACMRIGAYLGLWKTGCLDSSLLLSASRDYEGYMAAEAHLPWRDDLRQFTYLTSVQLALLAGDKDRAGTLLFAKKKYHYHLEYLEVLKLLLGSKEPQPLPATSPGYAAFEGYFDRIREPMFSSKDFMEVGLHRFELGLLGEMFFGKGDGLGYWDRVIERIVE